YGTGAVRFEAPVVAPRRFGSWRAMGHEASALAGASRTRADSPASTSVSAKRRLKGMRSVCRGEVSEARVQVPERPRWARSPVVLGALGVDYARTRTCRLKLMSVRPGSRGHAPAPTLQNESLEERASPS